MKPNDVYGWTPISQTTDLWRISGSFEDVYIDYIQDGLNTRILVKKYVNEEIDLRSFEFFSVWLDDRPFMIIERAGRGGDDYYETYITDFKAYTDAGVYLRSLYYEDEHNKPTVMDPAKDIPDLGVFYQNDVRNYYNPDGVDPQFEVGDVVIARVPENHLNYKKKMIETPVVINQVDRLNPTFTYHGIQPCRKIKEGTKTFNGYTDCPFGEGSIGAHFSDGEIIGPYEPAEKE